MVSPLSRTAVLAGILVSLLGTLTMRFGSIGDLAYLPDGRAMIAEGPGGSDQPSDP